MRIIQWLFVLSVALFVAGIGFVIAGARVMQRGAPAAAAPAGPPIVPVASIKQIMNGIVDPASMVVYNAVSSKVTTKGTEDIAPRNDDEWAKVGDSAVALVEAGNLLLMPGRAIDNGDWVKMTQAMIDGAKLAVKAAADKSADGILGAGEPINTACDNCHGRYQRQ
jgi:cytochrome c553